MLEEKFKDDPSAIQKQLARDFLLKKTLLKVQSCKLYNNKYMIASTQTTNTEIFAFITVLVSKLLSRKVFLINRKDNRNS